MAINRLTGTDLYRQLQTVLSTSRGPQNDLSGINALVTQAVAAGATQTAISGLGTTINAASRTIRESGDATAREGFTAAIRQIAQGTDAGATLSFARAIGDLDTDSPDTLRALMREVGALHQETPGAIGSFLETMGAVAARAGTSGVASLTDAVAAIRTKDQAGGVTREDNLAALFQSVRAQASRPASAMSGAELDRRLQALRDDLRDTATTEEAGTVLASYAQGLRPGANA